MPVTVIRPVLTEEERAERMARVEACIADFWRKLKQIEAQQQRAARAEHLREERSRQKCRKRCELCGEIFYANSGAARYCDNCREAGHDMANRRNLDRPSRTSGAQESAPEVREGRDVCMRCMRQDNLRA